MLLLLTVIGFSFGMLLNQETQTGTIKECTSILKNVFWAIVKHSLDKQAEKWVDLWMISKVTLVLHSQFKFLFFNFVLLSSKNSLYSDKVMVILEDIIISSWVFHIVGSFFLSFHVALLDLFGTFFLSWHFFWALAFSFHS